MNKIKAECSECINFTENGCIPFGNDKEIAIQKCKEDNFLNCVTIEELWECENKG